ncbi:hypothetical protein TUM4445_08600 [Shewanella sp. MBTL60-112-B2]|nr:hypothetical protein TUM4444_36850 [Shewanella sp. MBTL60-112-B1]GIU27950.1 hypothetical protein TUM4445_08600 [Shewanella sp. MBTL60-112-B2]
MNDWMSWDWVMSSLMVKTESEFIHTYLLMNLSFEHVIAWQVKEMSSYNEQ